MGTTTALWFSFIDTQSDYWLHLAPSMLIVALGVGLGVIALTQAAVYGVHADRAGVASALLNSAQQIGVALGLAVLAGIAATVTAGAGSSGSQALVDGYSTALLTGAGILLGAAVLAVLTLSGKVSDEARTDAPVTESARTPATATTG